MVISDRQIQDALPRIEAGLKKYCWIQVRAMETDIRKDRKFQTAFNGFYRVRRGEEWCAAFYALMEKSKLRPIIFDEALAVIREQTGRLEASFASKLVATIDTTKPIIDQFVLRNFGLKLPPAYRKEREYIVRQIYKDLCLKYEEILDSEAGRRILREFVRYYPWAEISDIKKIDFVLWQTR